MFQTFAMTEQIVENLGFYVLVKTVQKNQNKEEGGKVTASRTARRVDCKVVAGLIGKLCGKTYYI